MAQSEEIENDKITDTSDLNHQSNENGPELKVSFKGIFMALGIALGGGTAMCFFGILGICIWMLLGMLIGLFVGTKIESALLEKQKQKIETAEE